MTTWFGKRLVNGSFSHLHLNLKHQSFRGAERDRTVDLRNAISGVAAKSLSNLHDRFSNGTNYPIELKWCAGNLAAVLSSIFAKLLRPRECCELTCAEVRVKKCCNRHCAEHCLVWCGGVCK